MIDYDNWVPPAWSVIGHDQEPAPPASMFDRRARWEIARAKASWQGAGRSFDSVAVPGRMKVGRLEHALEERQKLSRWYLQATPAQRRAVIAAPLLRAIDGYQGTHGFLFVGGADLGKTTAAYSAVDQLWQSGLRDDKPFPKITIMKAIDLGNARRTHGLGAGDPAIIKQAKAAQLLLLDDLGQDERRDPVMFEIFDERYERGLASIVTSGFPWDDLVKLYSEAMLRRILQAGPNKGRFVSLFPKDKQQPKLAAV
jgi:hypothetical protein